MRLHTDVLTETDLKAALALAETPGVYFHEISARASRSHERAFEIKLAGLGEHHRRNNASNTAKAATYDEWGHFIARVFEIEPEATFGPYRSYADFHAKTGHKYRVEVAA